MRFLLKFLPGGMPAIVVLIIAAFAAWTASAYLRGSSNATVKIERKQLKKVNTNVRKAKDARVSSKRGRNDKRLRFDPY